MTHTLRKKYWGPRVETTMLLPHQVADHLKEHGRREQVHETCYDLYVVAYDATGTGMVREHVYHTHDLDDLHTAFEFWREEIAHSPAPIRALEAVTVTRSLMCMALKTDEEPVAPGPTVVMTTERNRG